MFWWRLRQDTVCSNEQCLQYRLRAIDMSFSEACKAFLSAEEKHELGALPGIEEEEDLA